jgi:hypothetical protein
MEACGYLSAYPDWIAHLLVQSRTAVIRARAMERQRNAAPETYQFARNTKNRPCFGADPDRQFDRDTALRIRAIEKLAGYRPVPINFSAGARYGRSTYLPEKDSTHE